MQHSIFGIMPPRIVPSAMCLRASAIVSCGISAPVRVEHALDVGEQDQLLGVQRLGDRAGRLVGVHVVGDAVVVDADRRDHGHEARVGDRA